MRTFLVILAALALVIGVAGVLAWPGIERRVLEAARQEAQQTIAADLAWEDADLALVSPFPAIGLRVDGLTLTGREAFDGVQLAHVERVTAAVDPRTLFGGPVALRSLGVYDADVHAIIDAEGRSNTDIFGDSSGGGTALRLDRVILEDVDLRYEDQGSELVADSRWDADLSLRTDNTGRIEVPEGRVVVNELPIDVEGAVWPIDGGYGTDVAFEAADDALAPLLSLVPEKWALEDVEIDGSLALAGTIVGSYRSEEDHWPAVVLDLQVEDGAIRRGNQPAVEGLSGAVKVVHPEGPLAETTIDAPSLRFATAGQRLDGGLHVADPFGDPQIRARAQGAVDLAALDQALPTDETTISGIADIDLSFAGRWSDFEAQRADRLDVSGTIRARDGTYESPVVAVPLRIDRLAMTLGPRSSQVEDARIRWDGSDLAARGTLQDVPAWLLGDGPLRGNLAVESRRLDLSKLVGESEPGATGVAEVPEDLALTVQGEVGEAVWKGVTFEDVRGAVALEGGEARLDDVQAGLGGGRIGVSGTYAARSPDAADVDLDARLTGMDVDTALSSFPSLGSLVPYVASASGGFDATLAIDTQLGPDGGPLWRTFTSSGSVVAKDIEAEPVFLGAVAEDLANARFEHLALDDTTIRYTARGGRLEVQPFDAKIGGANAEIGGTIGLGDRTLDLDVTLQPPAGWIEGSPLADLAPEDEPLDVTVDVVGTWDRPRVAVDVERLVQDVVEEQIRSGLRRFERELRD